MKLSIEVIYSPDDGGYYAEVFNENGGTVHTTQIEPIRWRAKTAASNWIDEQE